MTLQQAIDTLNACRHKGGNYVKLRGMAFQDINGDLCATYTKFEAIAIAEKYERGGRVPPSLPAKDGVL